MLAADAHVHIGTDRAAQAHRHLHEFANAGAVKPRKRIVLKDAGIVIRIEEFACVVTAEAKRHLRQIVRAEAEELCLFGDLVGRERGTRDLDHGADLIAQLDAGGGNLGVRGLHDEVLDVLELLGLAHKRDHDLWHNVPVRMAPLDVDRSADDGAGLHLRNFGIRNCKAAAAMAHHRVELVQAGDDTLDLLDGLALCSGELFDIRLLGRNELMQRRIEETDRDRAAFHRLVDLLKVLLLDGQDLVQSGFALLGRVGADHLAECGDAVRLKEHVLGAAQADALRAQLKRLARIARRIRICAHGKLLILVRPAHDAAELARNLGVHGGDDAVIDVAGGAVERNGIALMVRLAGQLKALVLLVHQDLGAAGDAAGTHAARDHGRMRGHAAAHGQNALGGLHAFDILRRRLKPHEHHLLAAGVPLLGILRGEDDPAAGSARRSGQRARNGLGRLEGLCIKLGMQQRVKVARVDHHDRFLLGDHALVHEVAGDLQRSLRRPLAVAGLQHVQMAVLDGELHVLHVTIMVLQGLADAKELIVYLRHDLLEFGDRHRRAHAGDDVFALRVHQKLAHQVLFARRGVARKGDARAGSLAHVAKRHHLHVDGGPPGIRDVVVAAVNVGARVIPGAEHGLDRAHELLLRVGREVLADLGAVLRLELGGQRTQVLSSQLHVLRDAALFLHAVDELLEVLLAHLHDHVGIHLDEAAIAVPRPTGVAGLLGDDLDHLFVEAQVQDGIHHARHGRAGAGTDGHEQRVLQIAELFARNAFHLLDVCHDLGLNLRIDLPAVLIVLRAGLGRNRKALRDGKPQPGHLRKVCALAAE